MHFNFNLSIIIRHTDSGYAHAARRTPVLKPVKPKKITSTGAVVNFSIFNTAEFRSQIRPIQDTLQPWYSRLEISFLNGFDI